MKFAIFGTLFIFFSFATLFVGDTPFPIVWAGLFDQWNPLLDERLPRLIVMTCTGASLAVSGAVMQALFQNPLASPSVLGITAGGSFLVVFVFILGWHIHYPFLLPLAAVLGCFTTLLIVYALSHYNGGIHLYTLLLSGMAIATVIMSIQSALIYAHRDQWHLLQTLTEWEAGSTIDRNWQHVHMQLPLTLVGLLGCLYYRKEINILALGEEEARNLGVEVNVVRWRLFICISILAGGAIAAVGIIAYFGLVLPNLIRKLQGPDNRTLIPLCILIGSTALIGMDVTLRYFEIYSFPIGNVSAIIGGVFFLALLFGSKELTKVKS